MSGTNDNSLKRTRETWESNESKINTDDPEQPPLKQQQQQHQFHSTTQSQQQQQQHQQQAQQQQITKCPYLDTINRQILDFDSEKLCSQTLSNRNVYVCLICGKFFEGRGKQTPAYLHALQVNHYLFMNLETSKSYCLPDTYEVNDSSLQDIQVCLSPTYTLQQITTIDSEKNRLGRDIFGLSYLPGFVGLNNLTGSDDVNVVVQMLGHIKPFRDYFLQRHLLYERKGSSQMSKLVKEFALLIRRLWSPYNFKSTISPQEVVQTISTDSKRAFRIGHRSDVLELLVWLLANLQKGLDPNSKPPHTNSILYEPFQGVVEVTTCSKKLVDNYEEQQLLEKLQQRKKVDGEEHKTDHNQDDNIIDEEGWTKKTQETPFTFLSLDIPPCPLFRDSQGGFIIPQVPLFELLNKFDGYKWNDSITKDAHLRKQYRLKRLPRYLIFHLARFTKNNFSLEKNPTIVTFPVRNLEMKDYLYPCNEYREVGKVLDEMSLTMEKIDEMTSIGELEKFIGEFGGPLEKEELNHLKSSSSSSSSNSLIEMKIIAKSTLERLELFRSTKYDLIANICHDSEGGATGIDVGDNNLVISNVKRPISVNTAVGAAAAGDDVINRGSYKIHLPFKATGQWYEIQDLRVNETTPQLIGVSESYILVYEKKVATNNQSNKSKKN